MNENKQLIQHVFAELAAGNAKPFTDVLADDVCWTIIGTTPWSRTFAGKAAVLAGAVHAAAGSDCRPHSGDRASLHR